MSLYLTSYSFYDMISQAFAADTAYAMLFRVTAPCALRR